MMNNNLELRNTNFLSFRFASWRREIPPTLLSRFTLFKRFLSPLRSARNDKKEHFVIQSNRIKLALAFFIAFIIFLLSFVFRGHEEKSGIFSVCIKNNCFSVEIADDPSEREVGLMGRDSLDEESGMLFVFEQEGVYKFWMKNTLIPLDMIWIDGNNKIVFIKENAEPCKTDMCETFGPNGKAKCVLEINGGLAEKMKLKIGDAAEFK